MPVAILPLGQAPKQEPPPEPILFQGRADFQVEVEFLQLVLAADFPVLFGACSPTALMAMVQTDRFT